MTNSLFKDRIRRRIVVSFFALAAVLVVVIALVAKRYSALLDAQNMSVHTHQVLETLRDIEMISRSDHGLSYCALTRDRSFISQIANDDEFQLLHSKLSQLTKDNPVQQQLLKRLGSNWEAWQRAYVRPLQGWCNRAGDVPAPDRAALTLVAQQGAKLRAAIRLTIRELQDNENRLLVGREADTEQLKTIVSRLLVLSATLMLMLGASIIVYTTGTTSRLQSLNKVLQEEIEERQRTGREIERFKNVLDNTLDMILMFDPATFKVSYFNRGVVERLGYSSEELQQMAVHALESEMDGRSYRERLQPLLMGRTPWLRLETSFRRKNGEYLPVEQFLQYIEDDYQKRVVSIARDMTERRRIEKMKNEFISTVSHELRTPLTSIHAALSLLSAGAAGVLSGQVKRMINIASNNSERLVLLVNDILDMEKIESGHMRFDKHRLELEPLLRRAMEANEEFTAKYAVRMRLHAEPVPLVLADFDRVLQVMANLLSNAAKFSPPGGEIDIALSAADSAVRVTVTDHGEGIPEEFRSRIFQKFSQADNSDARKKSGTGLGLSICLAIVERMGGRIDFESRPGEGSSFWFTLPVAEETGI